MTLRSFFAMIAGMSFLPRCARAETPPPAKAEAPEAAKAETPSPDAALEQFLAPYSMWLRNRDRRLPKGALVLFHSIGLPPHNPASNYKSLVMEDGRIYFAWKTGNPKWRELPADLDFPKKPARTLPPEAVEEIRRILREDNFLSMPSVRQPSPPEASMMRTDPEYFFVAARIDGKLHEVLFINERWRLFPLLRARQPSDWAPAK